MEVLKTFALGILLVAAFFGIIAMTLGVVGFFFWLSDGELWGLGLMIFLVVMPFAYWVAKSIRTKTNDA